VGHSNRKLLVKQLDPVKNFVVEPHPVFGFVDPVLDQTRCGYVVVLVAHVVSSAQVFDHFLIVRQQIGQHRILLLSCECKWFDLGLVLSEFLTQ
jgi:hypothetical protein